MSELWFIGFVGLKISWTCTKFNKNVRTGISSRVESELYQMSELGFLGFCGFMGFSKSELIQNPINPLIPWIRVQTFWQEWTDTNPMNPGSDKMRYVIEYKIR